MALIDIILISILLNLVFIISFRRKPPVIPNHKKEFYKSYIQSPEWRNKRLKRLKIDGNKCVNFHLFHSKNLHVHHKTYKRLGNENVRTDLITLCNKCHKRIHKNDKNR